MKENKETTWGKYNVHVNMFLQLEYLRFGRKQKIHLFDELNLGAHVEAYDFEEENFRMLFRSLFNYEFGFDTIILDSNHTEIDDSSYCLYTGPKATPFMNVTSLAHYFTEIQFYEKYDNTMQQY
jgi:hypothetical protein